MLTLLSALIVAGSVVWAAVHIAAVLQRRGNDQSRSTLLLRLFAPAVASAVDDPRAVLAWQPIAMAARGLFPNDFAELDRAAGSTFPFSPEQIERAHARWTADWLAWERRHDAEFKLKAAVAEHELGGEIGSAFGRARLDAIEREKLDLYQQRYEEYTRIAKGLQALIRR